MTNLAVAKKPAFKPMLACDADETKIRFPVLVQPKIDGVRALNIDGQLKGRSLKAFANPATTAAFSLPELAGFDGEMVVGNATDADLCRNTTAALTRKSGNPDIHWFIFDDFTATGGYSQRLEHAKSRVQALNSPNIHVIESQLCQSLEQLAAIEQAYLAQGYEGLILRTISGDYKNGRVSGKTPQLTRIKRFTEEEAIVAGIDWAQQNNNPAETNELGETFRSSKKSGLSNKAELGALVCKDLKTGAFIKVGPGAMTRAERIHYFAHPEQIIGQTIKYSHFPHGAIDKPRFPTFVCVRPDVDLVEETQTVSPDFALAA